MSWKGDNPPIPIPGTNDNCRSALITGNGVKQDAFEVNPALLPTDDIIKTYLNIIILCT